MKGSHLFLKTIVTTAIVVASNVAGNLFLSFGMKSAAGVWSPWVFSGVVLLIVWTLSRMTLLTWADLTFVLPVTAIGYPLTALMGRIFLDEQITSARWLGTLLIVAGTVLVGLTAPHTGKDRS
ncbi:MAG TPA: DMT family transporter [Bryobacteraceae bacterium]|nr:DMT family transporter [Bryobacteraceae bacterium]